ncbi:class I SAM-dependent methyltransferase [Streptomyces sp. NBC_01020]|uniref:class I SAM-dependent methyltransferase n=1 Tax=Streptomyces sp. NBC_01020 TaxID=2903722 RepID=UPI00386953F7|nr:class I SAM-dependent methyltransferase [Streptomyces sp. NBC_01020]
MDPEFYSKVATKFGGYSSGARRTTVFPDGDPEEWFDRAAVGAGGPGARLLDVGCADGRNLLSIAPRFGEVTAIDLSADMLEAAAGHLEASGAGQVALALRDASRTGFADGSFDVVTSRRGPLFPEEFARVLTSEGTLVHLGIGEQDVRPLKTVFGRGQLYGRWEGRPVVQEERERLERAGFTVVRERTFFYDEYFHSPGELSRFLESVPIFEDYDRDSDRKLFDAYVSGASESRGVHLARHWFLLHARRD